MKILNISLTSFKGRIIDSHAHIGTHDGQTYLKEDLDEFIKSSLPNNDSIEKFLVSDLDVLHDRQDEYNGNTKVLNTFKNDTRYSLLASCNPKTGHVKNIKQLYKENPRSFIGLKFHPSIQELSVGDSRFVPYFDFANDKNIPCLFHSTVLTDNNGKLSSDIDPYSDPKIIYEIAQKYPKVPFILAHLGAGWKEAHDKTIDVLVQSIKNNNANLYADISWVDIDAKTPDGQSTKEHIIKAIKTLQGINNPDWKNGNQSFRLLFGSDAPLARFHIKENKNAIYDYTKFIEEIKSSIRHDKDVFQNAKKIIKDLFYNNSYKLFFQNKIIFK